MRQYIIRRLAQAVPVLFMISLLLFALMQAAGDPLATLGGDQRLAGDERRRLERLLGLDQPLAAQYLYWLVGNDWTRPDMDGDGTADSAGARRGILRGDFGLSIVTRNPAMQDILQRLPATLLLMLTAQTLTLVSAVALGLYSAVRQYSAADHLITGLSYILQSMPIFWVALSLLYLGTVQLRAWGLPYLPAGGLYDPRVGAAPGQVIRHLILPALSLTLVSIAYYSRFIRSAMLEVIHQDYMRTARAKGVSERKILFAHGFRNAMLPVVTLVGLDIPALFAGALVTEKIYALPGMGSLFIDRLARADFPVLMGMLMLISTLVVAAQLATDVFYTLLDPRIRY